MKIDIRKKLKGYKGESISLSKNHNKKFEALLQKEMYQQKPIKNSYTWWSMAASIVLLLGLGVQFYTTKPSIPNQSDHINKTPKTEITLGNISPEFQTIETYYTNSINLAISQLDLSEDNKEIVDGYLLKIAELTKEYKLLTQELNLKGVNDATIDALIGNLQLRLQLLRRLKKQLNELKNLNTETNELQII